MRSTLLLSLCAIGVVGCGDHGGGGGFDLSAPDDLSVAMDMSGIPDDAKKIVTFSMFAQDFAQAICAHYMACGQLDTAQLPACIERNLRHTGWDQDVEIMKGRMEINELQCLNAVQTARCDFSDLGAWSSRCLDFLYTGHQTLGGACIGDPECASGYCQHAGSDGGMSEQVTGCPGVCAQPKSSGMSCRINSNCASGYFCDNGTKQCVKLSAMGEACFNGLGQGSGQSCQFGLNCPTFPATMPPKCEVPSTQTTLGGPCDPLQGSATPTPECGTGMYCQLQYMVSAIACTGAAGDCTDPSLNPYAYCNTVTGFCQNPVGGKCESKLAAAAICDPHNDSFSSFQNSQCADGTICQPVTGMPKSTCQPFGGANADCTSDSTCKIGFYCNGSNKCTAWFSDGQVCDNGGHCPSTAQYPATVCIADNPDAGAVTTCQVTKSFGATCIPGFEDGLCEPSDYPGSTACTAGGTCGPKCY
jgi:hypothetical protein